ncbi:dCTP deaminase [Hyphomicrobium sp. ghe19]|uniref:dCTP deaminase n=1 Tax=Hyphomicrobium sp. ghe19 TaxID=2682968 RepID=UPI0013673066|nr:Deoxycytidine triphosphate deaminase [Hyphomicrobium sp. ghe19]
MTILSGPSIRERNIFKPFSERQKFNGMSYGLSYAGYDIRLDQEVNIQPGGFCLASTYEHFTMPNDVLGIVHDKSTLARLGIALQNTVIEPGWKGYLTVEITNHSDKPIWLPPLSPIAQIIFHLLDKPIEQAYNGKYQDQKRGVQEAIIEKDA